MYVNKQKIVTANRDKVATAGHKANSASNGVIAAWHAATALRREATVSTATTLYDLTVDCLRLTMYFFHPIKYCAQQVYHTAVPLSPTLSPLHKSCLQSIVDNQLSQVTAFAGAPDTWGLLLRTIDVRPKQLTCIATSVQRIIAACEDIVNIYDAVTGVLRQALCVPERVTKIQGSPDGSILFFAHSSSVTMWDVQTGGLIHTFFTQSEISNIAVSKNHIACVLLGGSVTLWNTHTKEVHRFFGNGQKVVTIHWVSPRVLAVVTRSSVYVCDIVSGLTSKSIAVPGSVWGMVYLESRDELMVGVSQSALGVDQEKSLFVTLRYQQRAPYLSESNAVGQSSVQRQQLSNPTLVDEEMIVCISSTNGVQLFDTTSHAWINGPSPLATATSVAISPNRNIVVQTNDSIQIFSNDILTKVPMSDEPHNNVLCISHIYPLGKKYIICVLQPSRRLALLKLKTMQEVRPSDVSTVSLCSLLTNQSLPSPTPSGHGLVVEFGVSVILEAWQSGIPLPKWTEGAEEDTQLSGLSPKSTWIITVCGAPQREVQMKDVKDGTVLAYLPLGDDNFGAGEVYSIVFDSETRFYLKVNGPPGRHIQIPCDIITPPSGSGSYEITKGEPVPLSEPRAVPPYALDANCEWILDAKSRKVCWVSPENIRRGNGGHFWAGLSLVMVGDDGVVRKLTFGEPDR